MHTTLPPRRRRRPLRTPAAALLLGWLATAQAGPQEDYDAGFAAYRSGDIVGAMPLLKRAADAGHVDAQLQYGFILDWSEENVDAVHYYRMAAESGDPRGELELARMYLSGEGVERDPAAARALIEKAAARDYPPAIVQLGYGYMNGTLDVAVDEAEARRQFERAEALGYEQGASGLAELERRAAARAAQAEGRPAGQ